MRFFWDGGTIELPDREVQRAALYRAERVAIEGYTRKLMFAPLPKNGEGVYIQALVDAITRTSFWAKLCARAHKSACSVVVEFHGGARTYARGGRRGPNKGRILLPPWARTIPVMLHELAHVAIGDGHGHHWTFARTFIDLVGEFMGPEHAAALKREFRKAGVRYAPKRSSNVLLAAEKKEF